MKTAMRVALVVILALGWFKAGDIGRGYWIGKFTTLYPSQNAEESASFNYVFGPMALLGEALDGDFQYPYMQHGYTCQQRYDAFKAEWPRLDKRSFINYGHNEACSAGDLQ